jgi:S1-C subfamily serine protease
MKKVLLVVGLVFFSGSVFAKSQMEKEYDKMKKDEANFNPSKTIIHETNERFIEIENPTSSILYDVIGTIFVNNRFKDKARKECEKYKDKTFHRSEEYVRQITNHRGKFYCISFEENILNNIEILTGLVRDVCGDDASSSSCARTKQALNNEKLDLRDLRENQNNQPSISTEDQNTVVAASSGTGFFVSTNGHMVTNNHVIEGCDVVKAHYKGRELDANVLFTDRSNDLAIIKANIKPEKVFPVSNDDVSLLEDIIVAGYPLGKNISASIKTFKGSVTALAGFGDNYSNFQIDASLSSGNSGGPIINQKGNVVGVAVEKLVEVGVEGFNFGVKSSTLKTFASSNQIKFEPASTEELSNKELGQLITEATIYLECWMSVAKIKQIIEEGERQKAFFSEYK